MSRIVCSPCLRNDQTTECVKYCLLCNENLCRACFREHVKQNSTSQQHHRLIGRDELPEWLMCREPSTTGSAKCSVHTENDLDSMCIDHDVICCGACAVTVHRSCNNIVDLNEEETAKKRENLMSDCASMINSLISLMTKRKRNQSTLRMSTSESLKDLRRFRKKINTTFDKLEREMVEEIDTRCIEFDNTIENDKKELEKAIALIELAVKELKSSGSRVDIVQTSVDNVNTRKLLNTTRTLQEKMETCKCEEVNFIANKPLDSYINTIKNIGYCSAVYHQTPTNRVEQKEVISINEMTCDFHDVIQTSSRDILLLDSNSKTIVKLDENYALCKTYNLLQSEDPESFICDPYALCCLGNGEVAVSMVRDKLIKTFDLQSDKGSGRTIQVDEYCRGLAYNGYTDELYVACGGGSLINEGLGHIRVYNLQGVHIRSFKMGTDNNTPITVRPLHLALSNDCSKMYICDGIKGLISIDSLGCIIGQYTTADLEDPHGFCVDQNSDILVTGYRSNNVIRIDETMRSHSTVYTTTDDARNIQAICYDSKNNACVASSAGSNSVLIIHL